MDLGVYVTTCAGREESLARTLASIQASDIGIDPVVCDDRDAIERRGFPPPANNLLRSALNQLWMMQRFLASEHEWLLLFEDDVLVNRHIRHNVETWSTVVDDTLTVGTLFHAPRISAMPVRPDAAEVYVTRNYYGSQALLAEREIVRLCARDTEKRWSHRAVDWGLTMAATRYGGKVMLHIPALVAHQPGTSAWAGYESFKEAECDLEYRRVS